MLGEQYHGKKSLSSAFRGRIQTSVCNCTCRNEGSRSSSATHLRFSTFLNAEVEYLCNYPTTWEAFLIFPAEPNPTATLFAQMRNHIQQATILTRHAEVHWGGLNTAAAAAEKIKEQGFAEGRIGLVGFNFPCTGYLIHPFKKLIDYHC